jgi:hypothetical protein
VTETPTPEPEVSAADLEGAIRRAIAEHQGITSESIDQQGKAVLNVLQTLGWVLPGVPPVKQVLADARQFSDELVLHKLVIRFFRVMILGGVVLTDTPAAMDWLRDYVDGTHTVHGPLGKPMIWPGRLTQVCDLLRGWGFQPTPTNPQWIQLKPGGVMAPLDLPDPQAPDPRSVEPVDEQNDDTIRALGRLLDQKVGAPGVMAFDRTTVLRAMRAALTAGRTALTVGTAAAAAQLRDHQQQASEDGSMVTVSRQALDEVLTFLAVDGDQG